jgi:hypothetical protein
VGTTDGWDWGVVPTTGENRTWFDLKTADGWSTKRLWSLDRSGAIGNVAREDVKDLDPSMRTITGGVAYERILGTTCGTLENDAKVSTGAERAGILLS